MVTTYKGDNTQAFGNNLIKVTLLGAEGQFISKAVFRCGNIQKTYTRPVFPLYINFTPNETEYLWDENECYLQLYDNKGRRKTCKGSITITTNNKFFN